MNILSVISDAHGLLREDAVALLQGVDHIVQRAALESRHSAIRGNVDVEPWASMFPDTLQVTLFGQKIFVIHDRKDMTFAPAMMGINLVISGRLQEAGNVLFEIRQRDEVSLQNIV
ncbi:hypothetical protein [Mesorhizobium sp. KR2-14]|uniref:hypothetical protein n=1 Tax=Mesorhizobium sp. KR2-14 TaxID=3156610 RepID=UPI0032B4D13B